MIQSVIEKNERLCWSSKNVIDRLVLSLFIHLHATSVLKSTDVLFVNEHMFTFCRFGHIILTSADVEQIPSK